MDLIRKDPAELGYPPTFPIELALKVAPVPEICEAYGITEEQWNELKHDPVFLRELKDAVELVKKEGMSFKLKARLQAEELLKTSWRLIHAPNDDVPPSVKADLIKFTIRCAGLADPPQVQTQTPSFNIIFNIPDQSRLSPPIIVEPDSS